MKESMEMGMKREGEPAKFDWRAYLKTPDEIPEHIAGKLDELTAMVNAHGDDVAEFWESMSKGRYRQPLTSLVQYFREMLTVEERKELSEAVEKN